MTTQKKIIALVGFKPGREQISKAGEGPEGGIDKDVDRHAHKHHAGNPRTETLNEDQRGGGGRGGIAEAGNEPDDGVKGGTNSI